MPVEPKTKHASLKRRTSRKDLDEYRFDGLHQRELELKRNRGEVSCAECRRLKIKCDKQIPCQSCQRRGCAALCPNGSLATGQGTRFVLAATEHLHKRIAKLSGRIRLLEDALAGLQSSHPLLHQDLLVANEEREDYEGVEEGGVAGAGRGGGKDGKDGKGAGAGAGGEKDASAAGGGGDVIDAFGTLSISDHGISRFFGPTGGSESLLLANLNASPSPPPSRDRDRDDSRSPASMTLSSPTSSHSLASSSAATTNTTTTSNTSTSTTSTTDQQILLFSQSFPFTPLGRPPTVLTLITSHLPPLPTALKLINTYFEQVSWLFRGVTRAQVVRDMVPAIYGVGKGEVGGDNDDNNEEDEGEEGEGGEEGYSSPHDLALLFMIFAVGALVSPSPSSSSSNPSSPPSNTSLPSQPPSPPPPPHTTTTTTTTSTSTSTAAPHPQPHLTPHSTAANALGEHFHQIGRAALTLQPILEKPSVVTIQALHLMSIYNAMSGSDLKSETSMEMTWSLITLAAHLSQTIGLHRDSERWGLSKKMVQRRRILFWDLFVADVWQSLNTGRPPSFSLAYIDCSFPQYAEGAAGGFGSAFEIWQCRFASECVADVTARTLTAEAPSYATIMDLDRKVREFPLPEGLSADSKNQNDMAVSFQLCVLEHIRETVLMYIHRSFFAQAIIEHPVNPLKSAYAPSFLAAYRASSTILKSVRDQFKMFPNSCSRFWTMWTFAFSAAIIFGTVVTRGPRSPLAQAAMVELEQACILFNKASVYSIRAQKALPILLRLAEKARYALAAAQRDPSPSGTDVNGLLWNIKQEEPDDELAIIAGHTRFVSSSAKRGGGGSSTADSSAHTSPPSVKFDVTPAVPGPVPYQPPEFLPAEIQLRNHIEQIPQAAIFHADPRADTMMADVDWQTQQQQPPRQNVYLPTSLDQGLHYDYIPSERAMQQPPDIIVPPAASSLDYGWSNDPRQQHQHQPHLQARQPHLQHQQQHQQPQHQQQYHLQHQHQRPMQQHQPYVVPNQVSGIDLQRTHVQYGSHYHPQSQPIQHQHQHQHQLHQMQQQHQQQQQQQQMYANTPAFHTQLGVAPSSELADLGLASRDSRLDERWSSFMADSGLLDDIGGYRG